jgi:hypothetical protein
MKQREFKAYQHISFWKEADDEIVYFTYHEMPELTLEIAKELVANRLDYTKGEAAYFLIDATNLRVVSKEAREYLGRPDGGLKGLLAGAFISDKVLTNVIINLFFKINKPEVPARFFTKKEEALAWLLKIRDKK